MTYPPQPQAFGHPAHPAPLPQATPTAPGAPTAPTTPAASAPMRVVEARGLTKVYGEGEARVVALDSASLVVGRGEFVSIMGPSGSGKSTLLHCLAGLDTPTSGSVLISTLGIGDRLSHRPHELSGGQQQRVAVARALVGRPEVVFADEPTGALDTASAAALLETMADMCEHLGQTVVMVTHDEQAAATTNRIIRLRDGRITGVEAVRRPIDGHDTPAVAPGTRHVTGSAVGPAPTSSPASGPATTGSTPRAEAR